MPCLESCRDWIYRSRYGVSIVLFYKHTKSHSKISHLCSYHFNSLNPHTYLILLNMAARSILRTQRPAITAGLLGATGVSLWVARSYYTNKAYAESPEPPAVFSKWFGQSLKLGSSEDVNHNTKRLRFEFPNEDARSGLTLTCKFMMLCEKLRSVVDFGSASVLVMTWPQGHMFPTIRPYTPVSRLGMSFHPNQRTRILNIHQINAAPLTS